MKEQIVQMSVNGSGIRDTARVLKISIDTVSSTLKKANQRWLWLAIEHNTGEVLVYTLGKDTDKIFLSLEEMLSPYNIKKFYTDD